MLIADGVLIVIVVLCAGRVPAHPGGHPGQRGRHRVSHPHADVRMDDRRPSLLHLHRSAHRTLRCWTHTTL